MGIYWLAVANPEIVSISTRVLALASLCLIILIGAFYWQHKNELLKQYIFLMLAAVVIFASTVLFVTALITLRGLA